MKWSDLLDQLFSYTKNGSCVIILAILLLVENRISEENLKKVAEDFDGYIKVVADVERMIITAGGKQHVEGRNDR